MGLLGGLQVVAKQAASSHGEACVSGC